LKWTKQPRNSKSESTIHWINFSGQLYILVFSDISPTTYYIGRAVRTWDRGSGRCEYYWYEKKPKPLTQEEAMFILEQPEAWFMEQLL